MEFDVIVIGGGHAGIEAATASARIGARTCIITQSKDNFGKLSCNPAIGGIGKGTVVREIDALDGCMAKLTDKASIHRKVLNASKGPAVWGLRHQVDIFLYQKATLELIENYENINIIYGLVDEIILDSEKEKINGIKLENGDIIKTKALVITTGTFLSGKIVIGEKRIEAGRFEERPSNKLSESIKSLKLEMSRLRTGTPARLDINSINFNDLDEQKSDLEMEPFSYMTREIINPQISCKITHTNLTSHGVIIDNKFQIPNVNGDMKFKGPRYCPSIEDKIRRFSEKERHQIFLEPQSLSCNSIYPNGISTSMSEELQDKFLKTIKGFENVKILRYGYAIEYDFINPQELRKTLETKKINGLFLAGQIIGTTGYEEAAGLGIVAGSNAGLAALKKEKEFILDRTNSYIGIMIDDLVTKGIDGEPYRLFTSRSEYRITTRADNADFRLTEIGYAHGLVKKNRYDFFLKKKIEYENAITILKDKYYTPHQINNLGISINKDGILRNTIDIMEGMHLNVEDVREKFQIPKFTKEIDQIINIEARYQTATIKQKQEISEFNKYENINLPKDIDYGKIKNLSSEVIEKLNKYKPPNIGHASRISGITPAAINSILIYIK